MWNFLIKYTYPLFESICVLDGTIQNAEYHQQRFEKSYHTFYGRPPKYGLFDSISIPTQFSNGKVKLRISYNKRRKSVAFSNYIEKTITSLKLIADNQIDYSLKYQKRAVINNLYRQRNGCDDVLIVKNDMITDSSYSNIIFFDGNNWVTSNTPLLEGTMRRKLIQQNIIDAIPISTKDLKQFEAFQLINAMIGFDEDQKISIEKIIV